MNKERKKTVTKYLTTGVYKQIFGILKLTIYNLFCF